MRSPELVEMEEVLRDLLRGHWMVFPAVVFGMIGGDPNDYTVDEHAKIVGWLTALGYERRLRSRFRHAHTMAVWVREEIWLGERLEDRKPYIGIPLRPDLDLFESRAERAKRKREWLRLLATLR